MQAITAQVGEMMEIGYCGVCGGNPAGCEHKHVVLPPAYPEGSEAGMARWKVKGGTLNQHNNVRRYQHHDEWEIGGNKHLSLIDIGGSMVADGMGLDTSPIWTEDSEGRLQVLLAEEAAVSTGTAVRKGTMETRKTPRKVKQAYHQKTRGITKEVNP